MMLNKKVHWTLLLLFICFTTQHALAQVSKQDLTGRYAMNHDGWNGTLVIEEKKIDCNSSPWCDLNLYYIDSDNKTHRARIRNISNDWQHMSFIIRFSDHLQLFEGHFFSRDKDMMAGTTTWRKETFGFYARKKPKLLFEPKDFLEKGNFKSIYELKRKISEESGDGENKIVARRINEEGNVEIHYENGNRVIRAGNRTWIITPENDTIRPPVPLMAVMNLVPPIPDEPEIDKWFERLNANMDEIVQHLLNDEESFGNYKNSLSGYSSAERVNEAMRIIGFLID